MNTPNHASPRTYCLSPPRAGGFTLIEMMISITIGLGILAGLVGVLAANSSNSRTNDRTSELMTNGRYALNSIKQELRQAGFRGYTYADPETPGALAVPNECLQAGATAGSFIANLRQGVWGANDPNPNPFAATCLPAANFALGNDVLVLRRLAAVPAQALNAGTVYFHSGYERGQVFQGATAPTFGGPPAPLGSFALHSYVYYISPFTVSAAESPLVPALYRVSLLADGTMARELVASGIEHLQVQYGRLAAANTQYLNATLAPLDGSSSNTDPNGWDEVNSVRVWLLARNATPEPGYSNTNTYSMGGQNFIKADNFRRQLFTTVVQLRN